MEFEYKTIVTPSFPVAVIEAVKAAKEGWDIFEELPAQVGFAFEVKLRREKKVPMSRAEALAVARAAKAAKKAGEGEEE